MKYYRVKPEYDNKSRMIWINDYTAKRDSIWIANELYTGKELEKYKRSPADIMKMFDAVEISKRKIYWCFGARFEK